MTWLRFHSWPISVHMIMWSLLPAAVCVVALAAGWSTYQRVQTTSRLTADSRATLSAASELLQAVIDLETGVRGYALTIDPGFLEPYENGRPNVTAQIARLRELVHDRPDQLVRIDRVTWFVEEWNYLFAQPVIDGVRAGQDIRPFVQQGIGRRRIDAIRAEMAAFEATETRALADRVEQDAQAWRLAGLLGTGALFTLLLSSLAALLVGRKIALTVTSFAQAASEIASGNLHSRLPTDGRDELTATGRAINSMAATLSDQREELHAQNEALVDQIREAERARGELRAILDATSDAIVLVSPDRAFRSINRRFGDLFGVEPEHLLGQRFADSAAFFDQVFDDPEALRARLTGTASDARTEFAERVRQRWPAARDLALLSPPVRSENGEHLGRLYVFRDVTHEARLDAQRRQLEAERARAAEVQADLLPRTAPVLPGVQLAGRCIPAQQVGGDFFDWYAEDGLLWLTLGDVMGKGMPAALLMATVRATLRAGTHERSPAAALSLAQAVLGEDLGHRDSYVTLLHAVYEPATGRLAYVDAGHGHALIRRADGAIGRLKQRSFPLGMPFADDFEDGEEVLAPGDALILYSDGLVDAVPGLDDAAIVQQVDGVGPAQQIVERLIDLVAGSGVPASLDLVDDLTVVALRAESDPAIAGHPADNGDGRTMSPDGRATVAPGLDRSSTW
jgi:PAS domain S-box-containing protein